MSYSRHLLSIRFFINSLSVSCSCVPFAKQWRWAIVRGNQGSDDGKVGQPQRWNCGLIPQQAKLTAQCTCSVCSSMISRRAENTSNTLKPLLTHSIKHQDYTTLPWRGRTIREPLSVVSSVERLKFGSLTSKTCVGRLLSTQKIHRNKEWGNWWRQMMSMDCASENWFWIPILTTQL